MNIIRKATLATVLGATALTSVTPAMAQPYGGYNHRSGGDTTGAAIAGGVIGLALGAIIGSSIAKQNNDDHRHRYADRGWTWRDGYYRDSEGRRYDRDGREWHDGRDGRGYYDRRGYDSRGYGQSGRGYYGRDGYYGERSYRYGN